MQFSMSASGTPAEVRESVEQQAKAMSRDASAWPVAAAVRDHVARELTGVPADQSVTIRVHVEVAMSGAERPEPAGKITTVTTGTVPVEGKAVGVVGEDRVIATDPAPMVGAPDVALPPVGTEPATLGVSDASTGRRSSDRTK